jgi:hypothetical protein
MGWGDHAEGCVCVCVKPRQFQGFQVSSHGDVESRTL